MDDQGHDGVEQDITLPEETSASDATNDLHFPPDRELVEDALKGIPGVVAARIVPGYERPVDELHIVTTPERGAKQIVRDVQSVLYASFGIPVDHRVISVAQTANREDGFGLGSRITISEVATSHLGIEIQVTVRLFDGEQEHTGKSRGAGSAYGQRRAAARATLAACAELLTGDQLAEVEGVTLRHLGDHEVAVTLVHVHSDRGTRTLAGSALVKSDEATAVARSVLDALNRELARPDR